MPNRLACETSPYLLQHAQNPVDWYPWAAEALQRARDEDRPIFLSIGYSACHWCHVMEHESFEDPEIAARLNASFVCIKVDREERPDLDQIYMQAVQAISGRGGWPMSVFLTPQLEPFYGGTYWPPRSRLGLPGFDQVIAAVVDAWQQRREATAQQARRLTEHIASVSAVPGGGVELDESLLRAAAAQLQRSFDATHGGFGTAPKFPHPIDLQLLLRLEQRFGQQTLLPLVRITLDKMAAGGIYDHLAGGFARYSVDERWLVPHFEKMLYDNALLAATYLDAFLVTGNAQDACVVRETLDYVLRDMTDPSGGFHSTEDADSEGQEGTYYLWNPAEICQILGPELGERFCYVYDVSEAGNFEHQNILHLPRSWAQCAQRLKIDVDVLRAQMAAARVRLLSAREQRARPGKDDKILVSWNGLMIDALARAARGLGQPRYLQAAASAAHFIRQHVRRPDGRLFHCWRAGQPRWDAYLDDYANLAQALVSLYEASFDETWIDWACELVEQMLAHFRDDAGGALWYTAHDHEALIVRTKELPDSSVPASNAMAALALIRLGRLTGRTAYLEAAHAILTAAGVILQRAPAAAGQMLIALDLWLGPLYEIVIIGDPQQTAVAETLTDLNRTFLPRSVVACRTADGPSSGSQPLDALFANKPPRDEPPAVYVCQLGRCQQPASGREHARRLWEGLR